MYIITILRIINLYFPGTCGKTIENVLCLQGYVPDSNKIYLSIFAKENKTCGTIIASGMPKHNHFFSKKSRGQKFLGIFFPLTIWNFPLGKPSIKKKTEKSDIVQKGRVGSQNLSDFLDNIFWWQFLSIHTIHVYS